MVLVFLKLAAALLAYGFAIYCGMVILRNLETRLVANGRTMACSAPFAIVLVFSIIVIEVVAYLQLVVFPAGPDPVTESITGFVNGFNVISPILIGLAAAYILACLETNDRARLIITIGILVILPLYLALWVVAQWQIFFALN